MKIKKVTPGGFRVADVATVSSWYIVLSSPDPRDVRAFSFNGKQTTTNQYYCFPIYTGTEDLVSVEIFEDKED